MNDDPRIEDAASQIDVAPLVAKLATWIRENQPAIKRFGETVSAFLAKLPEWRANLEANTLLLQRGIELMRVEGYGGVLHVFSAGDVRELGAVEPNELESRLFEESSKAEFKGEMLRLYSELGLSPERSALLEEALELHRDCRFGGAITLLYSQLEGIVTDSLVRLGHAKMDRESVRSPSGKPLPGLETKLETARERLAASTDIFAELMTAILAGSDAQSTISKSRNAVLHGRDTRFAVRPRSTQLVFWMFAVLVQLKGVLV